MEREYKPFNYNVLNYTDEQKLQVIFSMIYSKKDAISLLMTITKKNTLIAGYNFVKEHYPITEDELNIIHASMLK